MMADLWSASMLDEDLRKHFDGKKVVVTGGAGFIGSNLAIRLVALGARPVLVDAFRADCGANEFNLEPVKGRVELVREDVGRRDVMDSVLSDASVVFNLAGRASHVDSMKDPQTDLYDNATAHLSLLEAARAVCPKARILYAGTRGQYGYTGSAPVAEDHVQTPIDVNGVSKMSGEGFHLVYGRAYGMSTVSFRLSNTYGPRHQMDHHRQGILNWFLRQLLDGEEIRLYGGGRQVRDTNYVDDVVEAMLLAAVSPNTSGQVYNLGGSPLRLVDFLDEAIRVNGGGTYREVEFPEAAGRIEIGDYIANTSRFRTHTGWRARSTLVQGLRTTLDYYRKHKHHYW